MQIDHQLIEINLFDVTLEGDIAIPNNSKGFIIFSHGSGSSIHQPKNKYLAERFRSEAYGYLLLDLLTQDEDKNQLNRFDLENLTHRLIDVTKWVEKNILENDTGIGYFGAGTGTATAIKAASRMPGKIKTIIARGGRADMADYELPDLDIPILMVLGGKDEKAIRLNERAAGILPNAEVVIIDRATNLFEETGSMEKLAEIAVEWYNDKLN
jgi:putative phosphoribosyl transferase